MFRLLKFIGFLFSWIVPFGVVYVNHIVLVESTKEVDMFGLIVGVALIVGLVRYIDDRVEKMDIRNERRVMIITWKNAKKITMALVLTWLLFTVENNLPRLKITAILICASFIIGYVFTLLGNLKKRSTR
jgi:hypothetical protein